jgi:hypothetical protein
VVGARQFEKLGALSCDHNAPGRGIPSMLDDTTLSA